MHLALCQDRAARNIYKNVFYETNRMSMLNSKSTLAVMKVGPREIYIKTCFMKPTERVC